VRVGVSGVPGSAGGFLHGSILVKKLSLTTAQQLRTIFFLAIVGLASMFMFAIQCDTAPFADMPPPQHSQPTSM